MAAMESINNHHPTGTSSHPWVAISREGHYPFHPANANKQSLALGDN